MLRLYGLGQTSQAAHRVIIAVKWVKNEFTFIFSTKVLGNKLSESDKNIKRSGNLPQPSRAVLDSFPALHDKHEEDP